MFLLEGEADNTRCSVHKNINMSITYKSTRGGQSALSFEQVVLGGLANDKGLFIPEQVPLFTPEQIENVSNI